MKVNFKKYFLIFLLILTPLLEAAGKSPKIIIEAQNTLKLTPLYIQPIQFDEKVCGENYAKKLLGVLRFNFDVNGKTKVLTQKEVSEYKKTRSAADWRLIGAFYVIRSVIREDFLTLSVLSTQEDKICFAQEIKLSQDLDRDRRQIHDFCARFHKYAFDEEGIYNYKLLFTYKTKEVTDEQYASVPEEIYQCDFDGGNVKQLTFENSHCLSPYPVFTKEGEKSEGFLYVSYKKGQPKIYWSKFTDLRPMRLSYVPGNQFMPCMSKGANKVVFINDAPGNPEVFMQEFQPGKGSIGKPRQLYACRRGVQASPTFSPDAKHLAFVSDKEGSPKIYLISVEESSAGVSPKPILLSKKNRENTKPSWSPDGTKLAYISKVDGIRQVWLFDFIKNEEKQLTFGGSNKENPQWAPDSLHLAFNTVSAEGSELYILHLKKPDPMKVKTLKGVKRFPVWIQR